MTNEAQPHSGRQNTQHTENVSVSNETHGLVQRVNQLKNQGDYTYIIGVVGISRSGKDTFVNAQGAGDDYRFGDIMKDMAYEYGMVPHSRKYYEENASARFDKLDNGKTALDAWIALDVIRSYNPAVFINETLKKIVRDMEIPFTGNNIITISGMRTLIGFAVCDLICDDIVKVIRPNQKIVENATLDGDIDKCPYDQIVCNDGTLEEFNEIAESWPDHRYE